MKILNIIWGVILALSVNVTITACAVQDRFLFHPTSEPLKIPPAGIEEITLTTPDDETIYAFYRRAARPECPTILFFHGNGGRIDRNLYRFDGVEPFGWGLMLLEWRGYSGSTGKPSEAGFHIDARTGWNWLLSEGGLRADQIVVAGLSIGSGPAVKLARDVMPAALILAAPYYSMLDLVSRKIPILPVKSILKHTFRTDLWIGDVKSPILIGHGANDHIIPARQSERLVPLATAPIERWVSEKSNHHNLAITGMVGNAMVPFFKKYGLAC